MGKQKQKCSLKPVIVRLQECRRKIFEQETKIGAQREAVEEKIVAVQSKCRHPEKLQRQGTFCFYCTSCGKQV